MKCPQCGEHMRVGRTEVKGTFLGFLAVGFSWQHCWFTPGDGSPKVCVVKSSGALEPHRMAEYCDACGALFIKGRGAKPPVQEEREQSHKLSNL